jgi:PKD repeat protein
MKRLDRSHVLAIGMALAAALIGAGPSTSAQQASAPEASAAAREAGAVCVSKVIPRTASASAGSPEACTITCQAGPSVNGLVQPFTTQFLSLVTATGCTGPVTYAWTFGDGGTSTEPMPFHTYSSLPTGWCSPWTLTVSGGGATCSTNGYMCPGMPGFAANAVATPYMGQAPLDVSFTSSGAGAGCGGYPPFGWDFDFVFPDSNAQNVNQTYTDAGLYEWSFRTGFPFGEGDCRAPLIYGTILVGGCFKIGDLTICSDEQSKAPDSETYTFTGHVTINGVLKFSGDVTLALSSAGATTGTLSTSGTLSAPLKSGTETLLTGSGLSFDVDGAAGTLTPRLTGGLWVASMAGLPFWVSGKPITVGTDSVRIEPTLYIGSAGLTLASFKATVLYSAAGGKQLQGMELIQGQLSPGIQFFSMSGTYDQDSDIFTGSTSVAFPFMGTWSVSATIRIKPSCTSDGAGLNGFDLSIGLPDPLPIGTTGLGVAGFTLKVDNICDIPKFFIFIGGDLGIAGVPGEIFTLSQMGVGYQRPYLMVLEGGTANLLGYPVGSLSGRISFKPGFAGVTFKGWVNFAGIYQSQVNGLLSVSKKTIAGGSKGTMQIPDFSCSWYNVPCRTVKAALTSAVSLPLVLNAQDMDMVISSGQNGWSGMFRGMQKIGPMSLAVVLQYSGGDFDLLVGPNYADVFGIGAESVGSPFVAEKSVTLAAPQPQALFAVASNSESSALPAITLRNPQGNTITPSNVGSYPGVHYVGDEGLKVALFRLDEAAAGTWTLGVTNLSASEVTFQCLVPTALPTTTFTSVAPGSGSVGIQASVSPTTSNTKVSFYFSDEASGGMGEPIVENLSAASGSVSATWNTSGVTQATYYLFARTDDGKNPPLVTYYGNAISVGGGTLQPPTNLSGSLSGTACDLQWAASPSAGVKGYRVLYTDSPSAPGYPFSVTAPTGTSVRAEGLDSSGQYRFAAVAFDGAGNESAPSEPWYSGVPPPQDVRRLQSAIPVSDTVPQNAWKYYKIAVPAEPLSLEAFTGAATGDVDLYLKKGSKPGASDYDYRSNGTTGTERIAVTPSGTPRPLSEGDWYVGVFGKQAASFSVGATAFGGSRCAVVCSATAPPSAPPNTTVAFQGQASTQDCTDDMTYTWTFGDKSAPVVAQNPTHAYSNAGAYTWTLTATSGEAGAVTSGSIIISAGPVCTVTCSATVPAGGTVGSPVSFGATASASNCSSSPAFAWIFGDGATSSQQNPAHTYSAAGSYSWSLLTSIQGATCTKSGVIVITPGSGCTLSCTATVPSAGTAGVPVPFASTATPSGCTGTPTFAWDFGDGQSSTIQNPSHAYVAGTYNWSLVVSIQGATCTRSGSITISSGGGGTVTLYASDFESGTGLAGWDTGYFSGSNGSASDWRGIMACTAHSGSRVFRFGGSECASTYAYEDNCFASPGGQAGLTFPADAAHARLSFWHRWEFENGYDGAMMRISFDHQTYYYIPASAPGVWLAGGYTGTVSYGSGTRDMWTGSSEGYPATSVRTEMDLDAAVNYALSTTTGVSGRTLWIAFGGFSDSSLNKAGWYLDDVAVTYQGAGACTLACTATVPATGTVNSTVSFASTATPSGCAGTPTFAWVYGDGVTSTAQNSSHAYSTAGTYNWSLTATLQGVTCTKSGSIVVSPGASTNDACTDAALIAESSFSRTFSTAGFGVETGEPTPSCRSQFGATAWFRFTPATTGRATIATCSSTFDTVLALYSGSCGTWTPVACNDDQCGLQSQISNAIVNAGTPYLVQVAGYQGATGTVSFSYNFTPGLPPPPAITLIKKASPPFKLVVTGSNLQNGIRVFIDGTEFTSVVWKNQGKIQLTGAIKSAVPKGTTHTFRFLNPDGGEVSTTWGW